MESSPLTRQLEGMRLADRRAAVVAALGPLTALGGVVWAIVQPGRITILHPHGVGVWALLVEAPVLVVLVGALFHFVVAPGLLDDLADAEET